MKNNNHRDVVKQITASESLVSLVLQIGVAVSSVIILLGLILFFIQIKPLGVVSYQQFITGTVSFPHSLATLITALQNGNSSGFIMLGVLLLIMTPIMRVATSVLLFLHQHDIPMTLVTLFVLIVLICSFFVGIVVR